MRRTTQKNLEILAARMASLAYRLGVGGAMGRGRSNCERPASEASGANWLESMLSRARWKPLKSAPSRAKASAEILPDQALASLAEPEDFRSAMAVLGAETQLR